MKKRSRFVIILIVLAVCYGFLRPSINWYRNTDKEQQGYALMSREDIRDFSEKQAENLVEKLRKQAVSESQDAAKLEEADLWLAAVAEKNYKEADKEVPAEMNVKAVMESFRSADALKAAAADHYGSIILKNKENYKNSVKLGLDLSGGTNLIVKADLDSLDVETASANNFDEETARKNAMAQAVESLTGRLDKFGLTSPVIRQQGEDRIYIEIPGEEKSESINTIIAAGGVLNFRLVDENATNIFAAYYAQHASDFKDSMGKLITVKSGAVDVSKIPDFPADCEVYGKYVKDSFGLDVLETFYAVKKEVAMEGSKVRSVSVSQNQTTRQITVNFHLDSEGAQIFAKFTADHKDEMLAILNDGKIKSAATIKDVIATGDVELSGAFSYEEANNLQKVLQSESLKVPLELETSQHVDATLGKVAQEQGLKALLLGLALVLVFMIVYYKGVVINALVAQVLNMYIMFSVMSAFNLTLTLSSVAGMILTVGMSVDANVIIFERIKEELRKGKSRAVAISSGFDNAFWAIMDSNITTFIAAIFLSKLGTGSIQGFAVSLAIGVCSSVFTALVVSRLMFDFNTDVMGKTKTSISWRIK